MAGKFRNGPSAVAETPGRESRPTVVGQQPTLPGNYHADSTCLPPRRQSRGKSMTDAAALVWGWSRRACRTAQPAVVARTRVVRVGAMPESGPQLANTPTVGDGVVGPK